MADAPSSATFPSFSIRKRLLTEFIEIHECSFRSAFSSALFLEGGIDNFPYTTRAMVVLLKYRPDCNENASVAYSVEGCTWMTEAQIKALFGSNSSLTSPIEEMMESEMRSKHVGYRGLLRVLFKIEDHIVRESYPQAHVLGTVGALHRAHIETLDHTKWISRIKQFVRDGLVMRAPGEDPVMMMQLGKMKLKKGKWVWVQLTKAQPLEYGYPSDFRGLLF
ncbi:hypothetical protein B0H19DRAFT_1253129 [Mycena capillaripes]|nr:hypothetical protein B0H19DRAFT_1253129 [Mycena capillaripes]